MAISKEFLPILEAAKAGGKIVKKYFGKVLDIEGKSIPCDFRTRADLESEKVILKILSKNFPEYNIFSEEAGEINKNSEYTFYVDPLDGTNNFILGIPYFSVSIGLMKDNKIIFGVVYNPIVDNIYYAEDGKGAFLDGKRIKVNNESDIKNCSVSLVVNYGFSVDNFIKMVRNLYKKDVKRVLKFWSVALDYCLLASGKIEAVVLYDVPLYDFVAGKIIVTEAGGLVSDFNGRELKNDRQNIFLASNGTKIHKKILESLK